MSPSNKSLLVLGAVSVITPLMIWYYYTNSLSSTKKTNDLTDKNSIESIPPKKPNKVLILYGTTTGTALKFSQKLESDIIKSQHGNLRIPVRIINMKDFDEESLHKEDIVVIITSTWTGGIAPESAQRFFEGLKDIAYDFRVSKDYLHHLKYAVFGLGGAIYQEDFCKVASEFDEYLNKLGAQSVLPLAIGDDASNLESKFKLWSKAFCHWFKSNIVKSQFLSPVEQQNQESILEKPQEGSECDTVELEEEDLINSHFIGYDSDEEKNPSKPFRGIEDDEPIDGTVLDLEDLGKAKNKQVLDLVNSLKEGDGDVIQREMVTNLQRKALTKEGYKIIGSHSAVKICRWTKNQMRGRGGCYKHTFYGITSYQCMEVTPSLACANKCVFCWRHHKNPVGTEWRWKEDAPDIIVQDAIELHRGMINELRGVPGVIPERLVEANTVRHCALSLVGEPIMYPRINELLKDLHQREISTFLVTNAQFPDRIQHLDPVTQLYVSVDAATKDSLKAIDRPLFKDFWDRFIESLKAMQSKQQRTVYRMTLVKSWNMKETEEYVKLIETGQPDFIEIKAVTYCGKSDASSLTMQNVPWHVEVCNFAEAISKRLRERGKGVNYSIATEHEHSCCVLLAREDKFLIDGVWHTWIDYPKFNTLIQQYYESNGTQVFSSTDYMARTPDWARYQSETKGFDPIENRWKRNKAGKKIEIPYEPSESGCG